MSISNSTLDTDVWQTVRNTLTSASITIVNTAASETETPSIVAAFNDKAPTRPQIVIRPIQMDEGAAPFQGYYGKRLINVDVEVYADQTWKTDEMSGKVQEAIRTWDELAIDLIGVTVDNAFINPNLAKYKSKGITFTFTKEL